MPLVSVLMTMRNAAATIGPAARSTLRALPRDAELVVHDDASTDESVEVLERVQDKRITIVRSAERRGVTAAVNLLIPRVDCRYLGRMDADDICLPWRFRLQIPRLQDHCDVSFGQMVNFDPTHRRVRPMAPVRVPPASMPIHLVIGNLLAQPSMLAKAEVIQGSGGYRVQLAEDYELWMRLCATGYSLERLGVPVLLRRLHAQQLTASDVWRDRPPLEPAAVESYRLLCRSAVGREPTWQPNPRRNAQAPEGLADMAAAVRAAAACLPVTARLHVLLRLRHMLAGARPVSSASETAGPATSC